MSLLLTILGMLVGFLGLGASIRFGGGIVDARGSIAGNTFSRNANGAYLRARVKGTNPETPRQTAVRNVFGAIASLYKTLTAQQVDAWVDAAASELGKYTNRLGEPSQYTPNQLFQKLNGVLAGIGQPPVTSPPKEWEYPLLVGEIMGMEQAGGVINSFDSTLVLSNQGVQVYASVPHRPSVRAMSTPPMPLLVQGIYADASALAGAIMAALNDTDVDWAEAASDGLFVSMRLRLVDQAAGTTGPDRTFIVPVTSGS